MSCFILSDAGNIARLRKPITELSSHAKITGQTYNGAKYGKCPSRRYKRDNCDFFGICHLTSTAKPTTTTVIPD